MTKRGFIFKKGGHACAPKRYSAQARRAAPAKFIYTTLAIGLMEIGISEFRISQSLPAPACGRQGRQAHSSV